MTLIWSMVLVGIVTLLPAPGWTQEHFPTPEAAARALEAAARAKDATDRLDAILGPDGRDLVSSGDAVDDAAARRRFTTAATERSRVEPSADGAMAIVYVGHDDWPLPLPIVRDADGWRFDTAAGRDEILNRRVGRNELITIAVCHAYVEAQVAFARRFRAYAQAMRSTPGRRDGLYWPASGTDTSPLGPLVANATTEGYALAEPSEEPVPYHGYLFRILTAQGTHAPGGARSYVQDGRMTGGFALVAWPAVHGSTGVMTFLVNQDDVIFQKDLGAQTDAAVKAITTYDPDSSWDPAR